MSKKTKLTPWNILDRVKTKKDLDLLLWAEREPYEKALIKALNALKELSNIDIFAEPWTVLQNNRFAAFVREEILRDLDREGIKDPTI